MTEVCIAGWSQLTRFPGEPLAAWSEALRRTGVVPARIDSLDVVYCQSWQYDDPARRLAEAVGAEPGRLFYSGIGGTTPLVLIAQAAERIAAGKADVCVVVAGEALASLRDMARRAEQPDWSFPDLDPQPMPFEAPFQPSEVAHGLTNAYSSFAMRDIARRAARGTEVGAHRKYLGELFAPMTEVAARNPYAWFPEKRSPAELVEVGPDNRMVAYPYTKRLMSIMDVDLTSAVVVASVGAAAAMGLDHQPLVQIMGWASANDPDYVAEHADLASSPAMAKALNAALERAKIGIDEVHHLDLYSCFPSAVSFALDALGLEPGHRLSPFTVTGGLPYAGGAGSGYALGSVARMAERLSQSPGETGMVTGVGMHLSKHFGMIMRSAPTDYQGGTQFQQEPPARRIIDHYSGAARIATYTVLYARDGTATHALLICDIDGATRCYATAFDPAYLANFEREEWVGRSVRLAGDGNVNFALPE